jgi:outer membrane protein OmpA-like peptidoglycan-associated protein
MRASIYVPIVLLAASLCAAAPALAQGDPTADDIVNALKPKDALGATRGIKLAPAMPDAGMAAGTKAHASQAEPVDTLPSIDLTVQFANGSAVLTPGAVRTLDRLGQALSSPALTGSRFRIEGHTDTVGAKDYNMALSQHRAAAVAAYLVSKFGLDASRLDAVGLGSDQLLVPTPDQTPEPRNRRVRVVNLSA